MVRKDDYEDMDLRKGVLRSNVVESCERILKSFLMGFWELENRPDKSTFLEEIAFFSVIFHDF